MVVTTCEQGIVKRASHQIMQVTNSYYTLGHKYSIYPEIHISKSHFLTKFAFSESHFSQNSHFENLIFHKIHIFKVSFFTKFAISKSHFSQNSHFQNLIFHKIHIFKHQILCNFWIKSSFLLQW